MIRRPPRSTLRCSSAASDVYKRQHMYICMRARTHTLCMHAHAHTHSCSLTHSHTHLLTLSSSLSHLHTRSLFQARSLIHSLTHTLAHSFKSCMHWLQQYLRNLVELCQRCKDSPLHPDNNPFLTKHVLADFDPFFRRGLFEHARHIAS